MTDSTRSIAALETGENHVTTDRGIVQVVYWKSQPIKRSKLKDRMNRIPRVSIIEKGRANITKIGHTFVDPIL